MFYSKIPMFVPASSVRQAQRRGHRIIRTSSMRGRPAATMSNIMNGTRPAPYVPEDIIAQVMLKKTFHFKIGLKVTHKLKKIESFVHFPKCQKYFSVLKFRTNIIKHKFELPFTRFKIFA